MLTRSTGRRDPFVRMSREMDRLFESLACPPGAHARRGTLGGLVLRDEGDAYAVELELPGVALEDIELEASREELTIRARRETPVPDGARVLLDERPRGRFEHTLALPGPIDPGATSATLADGVLGVRLGKSPDARPRRIPIG